MKHHVLPIQAHVCSKEPAQCISHSKCSPIICMTLYTNELLASCVQLSQLPAQLQAQDYRIQYDSIVRLFILPKSNVPQTMVVISLDPPIRKGQTYYPHILCQFNNDEELNVELEITEEQLQDKNEKVTVQPVRALSFSC